MTSWVCVDANVVLKLYLNEELSEEADLFWNDHVTQGFSFAAPPLALYEITATLRKNVHQGIIDPDEGREAHREILSLPLDYPSPQDLHARAYELATRLDLPTTYDANYLVVAQTLGCEFWTADRKLVNAVGAALPWVKWLGSYSPPVDETPPTT
jgi:predicted nucleic acid-binding protein